MKKHIGIDEVEASLLSGEEAFDVEPDGTIVRRKSRSEVVAELERAERVAIDALQTVIDQEWVCPQCGHSTTKSQAALAAAGEVGDDTRTA